MRRLLVVVLLLLLWAPAAQAWTWPVHGPVVQGFSFDRGHPYTAGQRRGIDIGSSGGAPVLAPASGAVAFAGSVPASGMCVTIETADGLAVTLTHLGSISVEPGARVEEGATIGTVDAGATSEAGGPYVHLGIRVASDPNGYLDPLSLLPPATTVSSPSSAPVSSPVPAAQQSSAGSATQAVAVSSTMSVSSAAAPPAASGPATGASAPVEVPASDFARQAVPVSSKPSPSPVARVAPTTSAAGVRQRRAVVALFPPARRLGAVRAGGRGRAPAQPDAQAPPTGSAFVARPRSVTRSRPALDALGGADQVRLPRAAQTPATPIASHSGTSAGARLLPSPVTLVSAGLALILVLLSVLFKRRRRAPVAPWHDGAVVVALPRALRPESPREQRLAA